MPYLGLPLSLIIPISYHQNEISSEKGKSWCKKINSGIPGYKYPQTLTINTHSSNLKQEAEVTWKLTTIKKNLTCESKFWIDFRTMRS